MSAIDLVRASGFLSDDEFAEFYRDFMDLEADPSQLALAIDGVPSPASAQEEPYILAIRDMLRPWIERMLNAFNLYYGFTNEEWQRLLGYYPAALRTALILTRPEHVAALKPMRRGDVYPVFWPHLLLENFKMMLLPINYVISRVYESYLELDGLEEDAFRGRFESEWAELKRHRDPYYGYVVPPRVSLNNIVRYLQLRRGNREIRFQASDYLLHLCQERPCLLEVVSPLFKERAFRDRVKAAYEPLMGNTARRIVRRSVASEQEAAGEYGEDVRATVRKAFDKFLREFDYYFKERPDIPEMPRWSGILGGLCEDAEARIQELVESQLSPNWDREIAFTHFIQERLGYLVEKMAGGKGTARERSRKARTDRLPDDNRMPGSDQGFPGDEDTDGVSDGGGDSRPDHVQRIKDQERLLLEDAIRGPDGKDYLRVNEMAELATRTAAFEIASSQLRKWARQGLVSATRLGLLLEVPLTRRNNHWLFAVDDETISTIVRLAKNVGKPPEEFITRGRLAEILRCSEWVLREYEKKGWLIPRKFSGRVCYAVAEVEQLRSKTTMKRGRPSKLNPQ